MEVPAQTNAGVTKLKQERLCPVFIAVLLLWICCSPAMRGSTLYSDLGPAGSLYNGSATSGICGAAATCFLPSGLSSTDASLFAVSGTGSLQVTGIDLAVSHVSGASTFYASIWTDDSTSDPGTDVPGTQLAGAYWSLSTTTSPGTCCSLVTISGITGVTLTGGQQYFMVVGPLNSSDDSYNGWSHNNQGVTGFFASSPDGGATWNGSTGSTLLPAFDVTSNGVTPEPATWPILLGLAGAGLWQRVRKPFVG